MIIIVVKQTKSATAVDTSVDVGRWRSDLEELLARIAPAFRRIETRQNAKRLTVAMMEYLERRNCWTLAEAAVITFRVNKFLTREEDQRFFGDIVAACAKFLEDHPGAQGIFSYQSERIYLQRIGEEGIVLSDDLRGPDFNEFSVFDDLLSCYPARPLGMVEDHLSP